jgi:hypothetical protein
LPTVFASRSRRAVVASSDFFRADLRLGVAHPLIERRVVVVFGRLAHRDV